jgi:hypothetical protein
MAEATRQEEGAGEPHSAGETRVPGASWRA